VKCKYWEKDGTCRYGTLCTFAHGDTEIRTKTDNMMVGGQPGGGYDFMMGQGGMMGNPGYMDPNFQGMPNMMSPYAMGFDPSMFMAMQNAMMGFPQGTDPNMMNMNQMSGGNPNYFMGGGYPNTSGGAPPTNTGGNTTNGN
jgi:hypothetical protein